MGQTILHCIVWKNTKESEHLSQIPKPHLSTSLRTLNYGNRIRMLENPFCDWTKCCHGG